uniref:Oncosphere protein Tm18 n=1 Tax=Taenia multiceps TaxID=94034 RepID=B3FEB8_TAEMU|nr:oncosphere protein Tm18 [Taenia multiceps]ABV25963.1 oncosphere protein Tm18 [Taenia multiceps]
MVCRFGLILLVAVVVLASGGQDSNKRSIVPYIRCLALSAEKIAVVWDTKDMAGYDVKMVKVVVKRAIDPRKTWTSTVSVDNGKVIMSGLKANTTYRVDVDGYRNDFMVFGSQRFVTTPLKKKTKSKKVRRL